MRLGRRRLIRVAVAGLVATAVTGVGSALAAITVNPPAPLVNQPVTFSDDRCDPLIFSGRRCNWDFGEGTPTDGPNAQHPYSAAGPKTITLQIFDFDFMAGMEVLTDQDSANFNVSDPPPPPPPFVVTEPPAPQAPARKLLSPFPRVRMAGNLTRRGAKISLLFVRAPKGATITARCVKVCRKRKTTRSVRTSRDVRISRLYGNYRAGAVLRITVTKRGLIGKYTSITIRRNKAPRRVDRCLWPSSKLPRKCPSGKS